MSWTPARNFGNLHLKLAETSIPTIAGYNKNGGAFLMVCQGLGGPHMTWIMKQIMHPFIA